MIGMAKFATDDHNGGMIPPNGCLFPFLPPEFVRMEARRSRVLHFITRWEFITRWVFRNESQDRGR